MLLPQELFAEQLWLQWANNHGVISLEFIHESLHRCNLKLRKGKTLQDIRLALGRGFKNTYGNMELARQQIAEEFGG